MTVIQIGIHLFGILFVYSSLGMERGHGVAYSTVRLFYVNELQGDLKWNVRDL